MFNRRLKDKYQQEVQDLEVSEKEAKSKYGETKSKLLETEDVVITLNASIKQLELQLKESQEVIGFFLVYFPPAAVAVICN